jgi:hypothetical protein
MDSPTQIDNTIQPGAFVKYEKMSETSGSTGAAAGKSFPDSYIVTEKVHGANFCVIASQTSLDPAPIVKFAKRTAILGGPEDAEDFYGCRSAGLLRQLAPMAEEAFQMLAAADSQESPLRAVHIYGELFGGCYPHPDIPAIPGIQPVQVGILQIYNSWLSMWWQRGRVADIIYPLIPLPTFAEIVDLCLHNNFLEAHLQSVPTSRLNLKQPSLDD